MLRKENFLFFPQVSTESYCTQTSNGPFDWSINKLNLETVEGVVDSNRAPDTE